MYSIDTTAAAYLTCKAIGLKTKAKNYSSRDVDQILLLLGRVIAESWKCEPIDNNGGKRGGDEDININAEHSSSKDA